MQEMRWGLLPPWQKDTKLAFATINARLESVAEKPAFRGAWKQRRALVPASGYYEWPVIDGKKRPHWIHLADAPVMLFGGVWESRSDGAGGALLTYSIVTRAADPVIRSVHDRMPLILPPEVCTTGCTAMRSRRWPSRTPCPSRRWPSTRSTRPWATCATRARS